MKQKLDGIRERGFLGHILIHAEVMYLLDEITRLENELSQLKGRGLYSLSHQ